MGYKRYEKYRDSGVEWIGEIPEGWEVIKCKRLFSIVNGSTPQSNIENYWDGDIVWLTPADLSFGTNPYIGDSIRKITRDGLLSCSAKMVPEGSLILSTRAPIGYVKIAAEMLCTNQGCKALVPLKELNISYFYYQIMGINSYIKSLGQGTTFTELSNTALGNILFVLTSLKEQTAIANFLDQKTAEIDSLIADKEKMIELLQERRQAMISEVVTRGLDQTVPMKDSGVEWIGGIPGHWEISKIKFQAYINENTLSETTDDDFEMAYIDIGSVNSIGEIKNIQEMTFGNAPSRARRIIRNGDTLVSTVRTYLKAIAYCEKLPSNCICSTGFAVLSPRKTIHRKYLFYLMRSEIYINEIVKRSIGVSYPAINTSEIGSLECLLPYLEEQQQISVYLDQKTAEIDSLIADIQTQIAKLKEYRQSLISEAVTGKIDLRGFVPGTEGVVCNA